MIFVIVYAIKKVILDISAMKVWSFFVFASFATPSGDVIGICYAFNIGNVVWQAFSS